MTRTILKLFILKLVGFCFIGTCRAQDKVITFAHAIAHAEGFGVPHAIPTRYHNPGNLRVLANGVKFPGQVGQGKLRYAIFKNDAAGWAALYHQVAKVLIGESHYYRQEMTFRQLAKTYAEVYTPWLKNVTHALGVTPGTTLAEYFELAPRVEFPSALGGSNDDNYGIAVWAPTRAPMPRLWEMPRLPACIL